MAAAMPYPDKFYAALKASRVPAVEASFGDETRLILYALESQAERGPCEPRSKWGMSAEDRAKHETWVNLGKMEPFEAMRLFVKLMDEERPGWWKDDANANLSQSLPSATDKNDAGKETRFVASPVRAVARLNAHTSHARDDFDDENDVVKNETAWVSNLARGVWVQNPGPKTSKSSVSHPSPRYRHASCVLGDEMLVVGGVDAKGRVCKGLELFHVLNLKSGAWRSVPTKNLSPCAGARLVTSGGNAYLVGGNVATSRETSNVDGGDGSDSDDDDENDHLHVSRIDFGTDTDTGVETATFVLLRTKASRGSKRPRRRRGHTATIVPGTDSLVVFGGEDENRRFLNDARVLDMRTLRWRTAYEGDKESGFFGGLFFGAAGFRSRIDDDKSQAPTPRAEHVAAAVWARNDTFSENDSSVIEGDVDSVSRRRNSTDASASERTFETKSSEPRATLLVLGGAGASGKCFDDAYALDLETGRWTVLSIDEYTRFSSPPRDDDENENVRGPGPRAGHASCMFLGRYLCVVGGGNDTSERREHAEASVLDLRSMSWLSTPRAFPAPPNAGEGMSLCVYGGGFSTTLLAFGGYDGACRDETHTFRVPLAFLDDENAARATRADGEGSAPRNAPKEGPRRSLFGRLLDPGPAPSTATAPDSGTDRVQSGSGENAELDALTSDNLRLRRENARLEKEVAEAHRLSAALKARLDMSESRLEETSAALAEARRAIAALETDARAERDGERKLEDARDESDEEEEPESRRGWLFGL